MKLETIDFVEAVSFRDAKLAFSSGSASNRISSEHSADYLTSSHRSCYEADGRTGA